MFGAAGTGDTSGFGRLVARDTNPVRIESTPRPWGPDFDDVGDSLTDALEQAGIAFGDAVERVVVDREEITFFVRREHLVECRAGAAGRSGAAVRDVHGRQRRALSR